MTILERPPGGPAGRFSTASTDHYSVFKKSPNPELAMGLVQHFLEARELFALHRRGRGTLPSDLSRPAQRPVLDQQAGLRRPAQGRPFGALELRPGKLTPALSEIVNRSMMVEEVQNMLVKGKEPAQAVADAHKTMVEVYKRLGEPT